MYLLITLIGNAAVDPVFRGMFLADPLGTAEKYGFRLTKGEVELLQIVFTQEMQETFERNFQILEQTLYKNVPEARCKKPPCAWSLYPPPEFRSLYFEKKAA